VKLARVFPRRTKASPRDVDAYFDQPDLFTPHYDEAHVSVAFTWDLPRARELASAWRDHADVVRIGGPATEELGGAFTPGVYLKPGYVITSRGCPNRCWFCSVWRREGGVRELPITEGHNIQDDNLLACSKAHILAVLDMLKRQKRRAEFTGGLEAKRFEPWMAEAFRAINPSQLFFAYDTPDDWDPLVAAVELCRKAGFSARSHRLRCYVLIGYPKDTLEAAQARLAKVFSLGVFPMAMLWKNDLASIVQADPRAWKSLQRRHAQPFLMAIRG
jgi:hypothetical protein